MNERFRPVFVVFPFSRGVRVSEARKKQIPRYQTSVSKGPLALRRKFGVRFVIEIAKPIEERLEVRHSGHVFDDRFRLRDSGKEFRFLADGFELGIGLCRGALGNEGLEALELGVEKVVLVEHEKEKIRIEIIAFFEIAVEIGFLFDEFSRIEIVRVDDLIKSRFPVAFGNFGKPFGRIVVIARLDRIDEGVAEFKDGLPDFSDGKKDGEGVFGSREGFYFLQDFGGLCHESVFICSMVPFPSLERKKARFSPRSRL